MLDVPSVIDASLIGATPPVLVTELKLSVIVPAPDGIPTYCKTPLVGQVGVDPPASRSAGTARCRHSCVPAEVNRFGYVLVDGGALGRQTNDGASLGHQSVEMPIPVPVMLGEYQAGTLRFVALKAVFCSK